MAGLTEAKKRDFISQLVVLVLQNEQRLKDKGYDPTDRVGVIKTKSGEADAAEARQQEAMAAYKDATTLANNTLDAAYTDASAFVDVLSGILGKKDNLVLEIKKMRK